MTINNSKASAAENFMYKLMFTVGVAADSGKTSARLFLDDGATDPGELFSVLHMFCLKGGLDYAVTKLMLRDVCIPAAEIFWTAEKCAVLADSSAAALTVHLRGESGSSGRPASREVKGAMSKLREAERAQSGAAENTAAENPNEDAGDSVVLTSADTISMIPLYYICDAADFIKKVIDSEKEKGSLRFVIPAAALEYSGITPNGELFTEYAEDSLRSACEETGTSFEKDGDKYRILIRDLMMEAIELKR